jgi:integrase/recombinase XerD
METTSIQRWLTIQANLGLAPNTVMAYRRALADYTAFCTTAQIDPAGATREHIARYVHDLTARPLPPRLTRATTQTGLANATIQQRLTAVRLYYDYLMEEGLRPDNPVGRGRYTPGRSFVGTHERGRVPRYRTLPWIPNQEQWLALLQVVRKQPLRTRLMLALAYDAGLRRGELCCLQTGDIDPAHRLLTIRPETTKGGRGRVVPYSVATAELLTAYLLHRRSRSQQRGPLFISESNRNANQPITIWTWSKVVHALAEQSGLPRFSTHTLRHLCLTDLARAGWELHEIALFAGHRNTATTLLYIHLSGHELSRKLALASQQHTERSQQLTQTQE